MGKVLLALAILTAFRAATFLLPLRLAKALLLMSLLLFLEGKLRGTKGISGLSYKVQEKIYQFTWKKLELIKFIP